MWAAYRGETAAGDNESVQIEFKLQLLILCCVYFAQPIRSSLKPQMIRLISFDWPKLLRTLALSEWTKSSVLQPTK